MSPRPVASANCAHRCSAASSSACAAACSLLDEREVGGGQLREDQPRRRPHDRGRVRVDGAAHLALEAHAHRGRVADALGADPLPVGLLAEGQLVRRGTRHTRRAQALLEVLHEQVHLGEPSARRTSGTGTRRLATSIVGWSRRARNASTPATVGRSTRSASAAPLRRR